MADVALRDAKIIGQENFELWSQGFDPNGYLDVLPHPDIVVPFKNPIEQWQNNPEGSGGDYFSSWGPDEILDVQLSMEEIDELEISGLGILKSGDGLVDWLPRLNPDDGLPVFDENGELLPSFTPYELLRGYQGTFPDGTISEPMIPGPTLVGEPGDKLQLTLTNNLTKVEEAGNTTANVSSNLHTHGYHTSPLGHGDNVLHLLDSGETFEYDIQIPIDQTAGLSWYHPHFHGYTNTQLAAGLVGMLQVNPRFDEPDLDKWNPASENFYLMSLNTFGLQQVDRPGSPDDPLNQNPDISLPAGTPIQIEGLTDNGLPIYELSDAVFIGYNAKPLLYDPEQPLGRNEDGTNNPNLFEYGGGVLQAPAENVIHTINGQYNPTLELKTGELQTFSLLNADVNSHHILQLYKEEIGPDGEIILELQDMTYVGLDGDSFPGRATEEIRRTLEDSPIFQPGQRITIDHSFTEPGTYYLLSNGTPEIVGEDSPELIQTMTNKLAEGQEAQGFDDGHYTWGPQVLMTFDVTGAETAAAPIPEAYDSLTETVNAVIDRINAAENGVGVDRERTYIWSANIGGAIAEGNNPDDLEVKTFEGTYKINGGYFAGENETPLAMPMLGTAEIWNVFNISGFNENNFPEGVPDIPLLEWHPFHIHQNPFTVLDINGQRLADLDNTYLPYIEGDTIALPPSHQEGTVTETNPYGVAEVAGNASLVRMYMEFNDYDGSFVNHCHILFHEDAGMMAVVRVILNTDDTWLGLSNEEGDANGTSIELLRGSGVTRPSLNLRPFGSDFTGGVDIDINDVNFLLPFAGNNVSDNTTDVVAMEIEGEHTVRVFDGRSLFNLQAQGITDVDGNDTSLQIVEFNPFQGVNGIAGEKASVATGDITGNGFADIVTGIVTENGVLIEIYDGENFGLLTSIVVDGLISDIDGLENNLNVTVGDAAGDNFEDIYIANHGKLTILSGIDIENKIAAGEDIQASHVAALDEPISPYGENYTGEIEITSGYVLQRPEPEDDNPPTEDFYLREEAFGTTVQGNNANITTLAVDTEQLAEGDEQVKIWTYLGGGHHGHGGEDAASDSTHTNHNLEASQVESNDEGTQAESNLPVRLDAAFTPESAITNISGTFADVPGNQRGEPVLFVQNAEGTREIFQIRGGNLLGENTIGTTGDDSIDGGNNGDNIYGLEGDDVLNGNLGNDLLHGFQGDDSLNGGAGNDSFRGGKGDDILTGGEGADILNGEQGDDTLTGGAGTDLFVFDTDLVFDTSTLGVDSITDFNEAEDLIELDAVTFTAFDTTENMQASFAVVSSESDAATSEAFIVYDGTSGNLYYNVDGTVPGFGSGGQFATLEGAPALAAENLILG
ncbi:multicopper oxidase domain-containing protein [Okeania sp.]|uniref:multicopper oxidase domain-containing protein n=1 Tax=Okeania sp. TaxID=3100323 RepID=UPI002B4AD92B|nr:multicopper oxidase domain-containing protein [Okeania sp.]MEB3341008.1 multicopper oxidase domain-containing protein [Okeania sp.]